MPYDPDATPRPKPPRIDPRTYIPKSTPTKPEETPEDTAPGIAPPLPDAPDVPPRRRLATDATDPYAAQTFKVTGWYENSGKRCHTFHRTGDPSYKLTLTYREAHDAPELIWYQGYRKIEREIHLTGRTVNTTTENTDDEDKTEHEEKVFPTRADALAYAVRQLLTGDERNGKSTTRIQGVL